MKLLIDTEKQDGFRNAEHILNVLGSVGIEYEVIE